MAHGRRLGLLLLLVAGNAAGEPLRLRTGELLAVATPVPRVTLEAPAGRWPAGAWLRYWTLVVAADERCAEACTGMVEAGAAAFDAMGARRPEGFRVAVVARGEPDHTAAGVPVLGGPMAADWLDGVGLRPGAAALVDPLLRVRARFPAAPLPQELSADLLAIHGRYAPECCIGGPGKVELLGAGRE